MFRESSYEYSIYESKLYGSKMGQNALVTLITFSTQFHSIQFKNVLLDACMFSKLYEVVKNTNELDMVLAFKESIIF